MQKETLSKIGTALVEKYGMQDGIEIMVDLITELQQKGEKEERTERKDKKEDSPSVVPDVPLTTPGYPYPYVNPIWGGSGTGEQPTWDWGKVTCDGSDALNVYYGDRKNKTGGASIASTSAETATSSQTKMVKIMDSAGVVFEVPESSFGIYAENLKARDERARNERRAETEEKADDTPKRTKKE